MKGYADFYEAPGKVAEHICLVCGTKCLVKYDQIGPTSWASAMAKSKTRHDYYYCPNIEQLWHDEALELVQAIENIPSKRVAALMQADLLDLLTEHGCSPTK